MAPSGRAWRADCWGRYVCAQWSAVLWSGAGHARQRTIMRRPVTIDRARKAASGSSRLTRHQDHTPPDVCGKNKSRATLQRQVKSPHALRGPEAARLGGRHECVLQQLVRGHALQRDLGHHAQCAQAHTRQLKQLRVGVRAQPQRALRGCTRVQG